MSRNVRLTYEAAVNATTTSQTLFTIPIAHMREFNVVIAVSSSSGFIYDIDTAPGDESDLYTSATNGGIGEACGTNVHYFTNNHMSVLKVFGSSTATVSASHIVLYLTSVEREN